jgi:hypothetical protein
MLGWLDPIANLWAVFPTSGGYHKAVREPQGLKVTTGIQY